MQHLDAQRDQVNRPAATDGCEIERPVPAGAVERLVSRQFLRATVLR
jgi:hypothetical protein